MGRNFITCIIRMRSTNEPLNRREIPSQFLKSFANLLSAIQNQAFPGKKGIENLTQSHAIRRQKLKMETSSTSDLRVLVADDVDDLWPQLQPRLAADAAILLKASRGVKLERLLPLLTTWATT